jgi:hypothetical protein
MNPPDKKPLEAKGLFKQQTGRAQAFKPTVAQPKNLVSAQSVKRPVAPPVYRPQSIPRVLQGKMVRGQPSVGSLKSSQKQPVAPPAYQPQPVPHVLQMKRAGGQPPLAGNLSRHPAAPSSSRPASKPPEPKLAHVASVAVQRKAQSPTDFKVMQAKPAPHVKSPKRAAQGAVLQSKTPNGSIQPSPAARTSARGQGVVQRTKDLPQGAMLRIFANLDLKSAQNFAQSHKAAQTVYRKISARTNWGVFWITEGSYFEGITYKQRLEELRRNPSEFPWHQINKRIGVSVKIEFVPGPKVQATKTGLVQTVQHYIKGVPGAADKYKTKMMVGETSSNSRHTTFDLSSLLQSSTGLSPSSSQEKMTLEQGLGTHIDMLAGNVDPMYAADVVPLPIRGQKPGSGAAKPFYGSWGTQTTPATLIDEPLDLNVLGPPKTSAYEINPLNEPNSGQLFETTALALEGPQEGTYYGSVKWGWKTDNNSNFTILPLTVISSGSTSETFRKAAELWNKGSNSDRYQNRQLPLPKID